MIITFQNTKLEKLANDDRKLLAEYGKIMANKIKQRLGDLLAADTLEDVRNLPGKYHELIGDRKGQWSCHLEEPNRLIFKPHEDPIPISESGNYIWSEIRGVEILEITNYHKK